MGQVVVIEFVTLDGVIDDPDGRGGTAWGGWAFRHGPEAVSGDKFKLGAVLDDGVLVLGRVTWDLFCGIWPDRDDEFSRRMNAVRKLVVSRSLDDTAAGENSDVLRGDLVEEISTLKETGDVVITGSIGVVSALRDHDLIDQYRLLVFPDVVGQGRRLFEPGHPVGLSLESAETVDQAVRLVYNRHSA